ncbi:hypothetical protein J6590_058318 [Homalodisca vitripennis]|nr:hypothetical protein J6590_058318 [Homalodisca vitripennis]
MHHATNLKSRSGTGIQDLVVWRRNWKKKWSSYSHGKKDDKQMKEFIKVTVRMEGEIMDIIQVYAPQTGCTDDEKREFEEDLERQVKEERTIIIGDFNAQVGKFRQGYEEEQGI